MKRLIFIRSASSCDGANEEASDRLPEKDLLVESLFEEALLADFLFEEVLLVDSLFSKPLLVESLFEEVLFNEVLGFDKVSGLVKYAVSAVKSGL
ncbi:MAG: hypothetical protein Q7262_04090 [Bacteroidales bacterium]|nr:hypothetical protein [Bacteroidales bacterium]